MHGARQNDLSPSLAPEAIETATHEHESDGLGIRTIHLETGKVVMVVRQPVFSRGMKKERPMPVHC